MTTNKLRLKAKKHKFITLKNDNLFYGFLSVAVFLIIILLLTNPTKYNQSTLSGLQLFIVAVLPGLFPFMFLTKLLTNFGMVKKISTKLSPITTFLFNTNGISSYVFIMSILSGYPIGAKLIADLYISGNITQQDAKKMVSFCTTSGPIFIIGTVGSVMLGSAKIGIIIYLSHILSSIMCGIILSGKRNKKNNSQTLLSNDNRPDDILSNTMSNTVQSIFIVGAYISIFFLLADILTDIGILGGLSNLADKALSLIGINNVGSGFIGGLLEVTRGCKILSQSISLWSVCFTCGIISFSGLSIILQSLTFLNKCKIKARYFIFVKCVHCILSIITCFALCNIFSLF